jgi:tetratricopeptide (TPR) repeat protein
MVAAACCTLVQACSPGTPEPNRSCVPITTSSKPALKAFLKGRDLLEKLRGDEGREYFARAVALDPDFALAHLYLAQTAATPSDLFPALRRAVELAGRVSAGEAHVIRAFEAGVNSKPEVQREHLEALVKAFPDEARCHFRLGTFYFSRQEWPQAVAAYEKAIHIDPDFAPAYNQLGYALRYLGRLDEASRAFCTYMTLVPDEPNPYDSHAELLLLMGRHRDAIAEYQRALAVNPSFAPSYVGIGNAYILLGDFPAARKAFATLRYLAADDGQRRQATIWLASTSLHEGKPSEALDLIREDFEAARSRDDRVAMANDLNLTANVLMETGNLDEALETFEESLRTVESAIATRDVKEAARRNMLYSRARVAVARDDAKAASALTTDYCRLAEGKQVPFELRLCHELRGRVALATGDPRTAITQLGEANSQDPQVLFELALAYRAAGEADAARETLSRVVNFNVLSFPLAFVRPKALALLQEGRRGIPAPT